MMGMRDEALLHAFWPDVPLQGALMIRVEALLTLAPCASYAAKVCSQSEAHFQALDHSLSTVQALSPCQARQRTRRKVISMQ